MFQLSPFLRALRPALTGLRPVRFTLALLEKKKILFVQNVNAFFVFSDSRCKNACKMLADLRPCFHQSPTRPNFGRSRVKVCPILCRLRTKLCPNFGRSRARLYPIYFAPCPLPNLAGTLRQFNTDTVRAVWRLDSRYFNIDNIGLGSGSTKTYIIVASAAAHVG